MRVAGVDGRAPAPFIRRNGASSAIGADEAVRSGGAPILKRRRHAFLLASLALHALVAAALVVRIEPAQSPPEEPLDIEIVTLPPPEPPPAPPAPPAEARPTPRPADPSAGSEAVPPPSPAETARPTPEPAPPPPPAPVWHRPTVLLAARALADPRSRGARQALGKLDAGERMVQLCGLEAMAQVAALGGDYRPDRFVAYAGAPVKAGRRTLEADGAAFRSRGAWHAIRLRCSLAADGLSVTGLSFAIGDPVPREEWSKRSLPAPDLDRE